MYISTIIAVALANLIMITVASVFAGGPRLDYPSDSTSEGADFWVD